MPLVMMMTDKKVYQFLNRAELLEQLIIRDKELAALQDTASKLIPDVDTKEVQPKKRIYPNPNLAKWVQCPVCKKQTRWTTTLAVCRICDYFLKIEDGDTPESMRNRLFELVGHSKGIARSGHRLPRKL